MDKAAIVVLISLLPLWVISLFLFSKAGWYKLSRNYKSVKAFYGNNYGKFNARINDLNYAGRLYLQYNEEGINLSVIQVYRLFHPPIFIPWTDVAKIDKGEENVFITIGDGSESCEIQITNQTYEKLEKTLVLYKENVSATF